MVSNSNMSSANLSVAKMNFMEISSLAEQFVLQYYVVMDKCPELLHRFYGENSRVIYESSPICGQHDIHEAFSKLKLSDTRVVLHTVDALKANENSVMVQVCGEISVAGGEPRRFMRSFTLCEKTQSDFYVLSDIFRYQDRVYIPEPNDTNPSPVGPVAEPKESKKPAPEKKRNVKPNGVAHTQKQQLQRPQPQEKKHDVPSPPVTNSVEQEPRKVESPAPRSITPKAKLDESHHQIEQPVMPDPVPQPSAAAPMSWAQRASGIATASSTASHMFQPQPPQSTKPISNPESVPASTGSQRNSNKSQRGPRQQQADTRRDSNSDRSDYYQQQQPQAPQQQQSFLPSGGRGHAGPRGGGGRGTRGAMLSRGGGGSNRGTAGAALRR